jgi:putative restriction endonuclease
MRFGLDFTIYTKKKRDPKFREKILRAYGYSCAVCGFKVRLAHALVGVEAAHIKWHQAGGPDSEENGIALCSLHHKLFDRGVFTLTPDRKMVVFQDAHGTRGFEEWLMRFNGQAVREPIQPYYYPDSSFLHWHVREVFKGPQYGN